MRSSSSKLISVSRAPNLHIDNAKMSKVSVYNMRASEACEACEADVRGVRGMNKTSEACSGGWTRSAKHAGASCQFVLSCNKPSCCADLKE